MNPTTSAVRAPRTAAINPSQLRPNSFSLSIYGDPSTEIDDLMASIREHGILVPLVVTSDAEPGTWEVISGHRRLVCARALGLPAVPCQLRQLPPGQSRRKAVLEYNRQRNKTFSQLMREADALEELWGPQAQARSLANLGKKARRSADASHHAAGLNSDDQEDDRAVDATGRQKTRADQHHRGRTDVAIARHVGIGGKDLYRQARAIWNLAQSGDIRAQSGVAQLDSGTKTVHAAYKDLRRRDRFGPGFRPTPYDVWSFRHDPAFGIPHPGAIPAAIVAHTLHYYTHPGGLVVDPMAGGGTTLDVCRSMGRRCLAYDLHPSRPEIQAHDIRRGFPPETAGCDLIFCDPPYHTMLAGQYPPNGIAGAPLGGWLSFLRDLAAHAFTTVRPGGCLALLLAPQTEKDLPSGFGYLDHPFFGYVAATRAGFLPERRITCPMSGAYLPQHVRRARTEGRLLGQVRDLLIMRKPSQNTDYSGVDILSPERAWL